MSYVCNNKTTKSRDKKKKDLINKIINEYRLKMNSFNPNGNSPNLFVKKLELRMKQYYGLYRSSKDSVK
jgi:hypothetical protein